MTDDTLSVHAVISFLLVLCLSEINAGDKKHSGYLGLKNYDFENFQYEIYVIEIIGIIDLTHWIISAPGVA